MFTKATLSFKAATNMRGSRGGGGGGAGVRTPPGIWKFYLKKGNFGIFVGVGPPLVCDQKLPFSLDPLS